MTDVAFFLAVIVASLTLSWVAQMIIALLRKAWLEWQAHKARVDWIREGGIKR